MADTPDEAAKQIEAMTVKTTECIHTFLKGARVMLISETRDHFRYGRGPDGNAWKPLKFARPSGGNPLPLQNTGLLKISLVGKSETGPPVIDIMSVNSLTIGTNRRGANLMQFGGTVVPTKAKALTIPATMEAARFPARQFPRTLTMLWRNGAKSGVLMEFPKREKGKKRTGKVAGIVQYYLVKSVVVPARPFLGFGLKTIGKLQSLMLRTIGKYFGGEEA